MTMGLDMTNNDNGSEQDSIPAVDAKGTYDRFMGITKWAVIAIALALILMALFLA